MVLVKKSCGKNMGGCGRGERHQSREQWKGDKLRRKWIGKKNSALICRDSKAGVHLISLGPGPLQAQCCNLCYDIYQMYMLACRSFPWWKIGACDECLLHKRKVRWCETDLCPLFFFFFLFFFFAGGDPAETCGHPTLPAHLSQHDRDPLLLTPEVGCIRVIFCLGSLRIILYLAALKVEKK